jgi:hypothetical protein
MNGKIIDVEIELLFDYIIYLQVGRRPGLCLRPRPALAEGRDHLELL